MKGYDVTSLKRVTDLALWEMRNEVGFHEMMLTKFIEGSTQYEATLEMLSRLEQLIKERRLTDLLTGEDNSRGPL